MPVYRTILTVLLLIITSRAYSQSLNKEEAETAIKQISKLINENYVFPAKGQKIATYILDQYRKGTFNGLKSWKEFDSVVTKSLRDFSGDGHLYAGNNPLIVKELLNPPKEIPADNTEGLRKAMQNNFGFKEVKILEENIGYIKVDKIDISEHSLPVLFAAMQFIFNTRALIIDLRNNGGGGGEIGPVFESFFLPKNTPLLDFKTRNGNNTVEKTIGWLPQKRYNNPLYILVNKKTASAAEAFTYALQYHKRAKVVGEGSAGAANMNSWYPVNDQIYFSVSTASPTIPGTEKSWEGKGIEPDIVTKQGEEIATILKLLK